MKKKLIIAYYINGSDFDTQIINSICLTNTFICDTIMQTVR